MPPRLRASRAGAARRILAPAEGHEGAVSTTSLGLGHCGTAVSRSQVFGADDLDPEDLSDKIRLPDVPGSFLGLSRLTGSTGAVAARAKVSRCCYSTRYREASSGRYDASCQAASHGCWNILAFNPARASLPVEDRARASSKVAVSSRLGHAGGSTAAAPVPSAKAGWQNDVIPMEVLAAGTAIAYNGRKGWTRGDSTKFMITTFVGTGSAKNPSTTSNIATATSVRFAGSSG